MGEYKEHLISGGDLVVTERDWYISYYFPGPDMRYNGTFFSINGKDVDKYIAAWINNFEKYKKLKNTLSLNGTYEITGEAGMKISIGGYRDGVCIDAWHMNIREQSKIDRIIADYKQCKVKAVTIQNMLKSL